MGFIDLKAAGIENMVLATNLQNILFVDPNGDNSTAMKGDINRAWSDPWSAGLSAQIQDGDTIYIFPGTYDGGGTQMRMVNNNNVTVWGIGVTLTNMALGNFDGLIDPTVSKAFWYGRINIVGEYEFCFNFNVVGEDVEAYFEMGILDGPIRVCGGGADQTGVVIFDAIEHRSSSNQVGPIGFGGSGNDPNNPLLAIYKFGKMIYDNGGIIVPSFAFGNAGNYRVEVYTDYLYFNQNGSGNFSFIQHQAISDNIEYSLNFKKAIITDNADNNTGLLRMEGAGTLSNFKFNCHFDDCTLDNVRMVRNITSGGSFDPANFRFTGNYNVKNVTGINLSWPTPRQTFDFFCNITCEDEVFSGASGNALNTYRFKDARLETTNGGTRNFEFIDNTADFEFLNCEFINDGVASALNTTVPRTITSSGSRQNTPTLPTGGFTINQYILF